MKFFTFFLLTFFSLFVASGQTPVTNLGNKQPFVIGVIDTVSSTILKEKRIVNIYLPEGYATDTAKYNVVYLLDGSADEDFIHIAGLVQFANFPWINLLPKSIVVGIANIDRKRDFTYPTTIAKDKQDFPTTGSSESFINFIEKELQPFITKNYKVNSNKMLIGQSLGGLLATEILFKKPTLFNQYVIISPSLWWDNESLLKLNPECLQANFQQVTPVFVAVGKEGKIMESDAKALFKLLKKSKNKNLQVKFEYFGNENHANILHHAVYKAFESFGVKK
jgi:predicted alpha/beta superfamily hydrolase